MRAVALPSPNTVCVARCKGRRPCRTRLPDATWPRSVGRAAAAPLDLPLVLHRAWREAAARAMPARLSPLQLEEKDASRHKGDGQGSQPRHRLAEQQKAHDEDQRGGGAADDERRGDAQPVLVREEAEGVHARRRDTGQGRNHTASARRAISWPRARITSITIQFTTKAAPVMTMAARATLIRAAPSLRHTDQVAAEAPARTANSTAARIIRCASETSPQDPGHADREVETEEHHTQDQPQRPELRAR